MAGKSQPQFLPKPLKFRPAGSPAGTWPHTPWHVCVLHDPYERVNVWSHGLPALVLFTLGILARASVVPGGWPLFVFCMCATVTHTSSFITHIWPDDSNLEKLDHVSIPFLIIGTPLTAIMAVSPEGPYHIFAGVAIGLMAAAFCKPLLRTVLFVVLGIVLFAAHFFIVNGLLLTQVMLYLLGAFAFIRNGGHARSPGLQDHHFLHYSVTVACALHVLYIWDAVKAHGTAQQ